MRRVSKSYAGIHALRNIEFDIAPGEVHALVGENGAGKSTLVKIITGIETAGSGQILLDGAECRFRSPMDAWAHGVVAVYQDPKLFPSMDVAENMFMGIHPRTSLRFVDWGPTSTRAHYGVALDRPDALRRVRASDVRGT
jgi:rhamnose transport system ATP-binding protein